MSGSDGDLARLTVLRDRLEAALQDCESTRDLPGLSREYRQLLADIRDLHTGSEVDTVDQLAARRGAKDQAGATG